LRDQEAGCFMLEATDKEVKAMKKKRTQICRKVPNDKKTKGGKVQSSKLKEEIERERKKFKQERQRRQQAREKGTNCEADAYMHKKSLQERIPTFKIFAPTTHHKERIYQHDFIEASHALKEWFERETKGRFDVQVLRQASSYLQSRITQLADHSIILD
jgi:hypothetical protein